MTAINHALTGAVIGLMVGNPLIALPVAFLSHFALDAIPHYDPPAEEELSRLRSKRFLREHLLINGFLCVILVAGLFVLHPHNWVIAVLTAFVATSPDLFWIPKYVRAKKHNILMENNNFFWRFHHALPRRSGPDLWWVEALWLVIAGTALIVSL